MEEDRKYRVILPDGSDFCRINDDMIRRGNYNGEVNFSLAEAKIIARVTGGRVEIGRPDDGLTGVLGE